MALARSVAAVVAVVLVVGLLIGSKRETVTKAFTLLQQAGIVELKRRRIHVKDMEVLKKVADRGLHPIPIP